MFEQKHQQLAPVPVFVRRMVVYVLLVGLLILSVLTAGVIGYHYLAGFTWVDSLLNASMILGGMGEIDPLPNTTAKIFAIRTGILRGKPDFFYPVADCLLCLLENFAFVIAH